MKKVLVIACILYSFNALGSNSRDRDSSFRYGEQHKLFFEAGINLDLNFHSFSYGNSSSSIYAIDNTNAKSPVNFSFPVKVALMFEATTNFNIGAGVRYAYNPVTFNTSDSFSRATLSLQTVNYYIRAEYWELQKDINILEYGELGSGAIISTPSIVYGSPIYMAVGVGFETRIGRKSILTFDGHAILNYLNTDDQQYQNYYIFSLGVGMGFKF